MKIFLKNKIFYFAAIFIVAFFGFVKTTHAEILNTSTITSKIENFNNIANFGIFSWSSSITPGITNVTMQVRTGSTAIPTSDSDENWTAWTSVTNGQDLDSPLDGKQYFQYKATLTSENINYVPNLDEVQINWSIYDTNPTSLISSPYNTQDAFNAIGGINWTQNSNPLPANTEMNFYIRTGDQESSLYTNDWTKIAYSTNINVIPSGCTNTNGTITCNNSVIPSSLKDGINDQWVQYKVELISNGNYTPNLGDLTIVYVVNEPPEISITNTIENPIQIDTDGKVIVNYQARDVDTFTGATRGLLNISLQYCTANCETSGGETWANATSLEGDFGANVSVNTTTPTDYTDHTITWTPKNDYSNQYNGSNFKIRLKANDSEGANNLAYAVSPTFILDTVNPAMNSFVIDARENSTNTITMSATDQTMTGLKIKISYNSDLSNNTWLDYSNTKTLTITGNPVTIYYQLKDKYGNVSQIYSKQTPTSPSSVFFQDVSFVPNQEWREFIAWGVVTAPPEGFKQYTIYRSTDGTNYSQIATEEDRTINYYIDNGLNRNTTYYYKVTAQDNNNNISIYSNIASDRPDGQGGSDLTAPTITQVTISNITTQSATITWQTDEPSNSYIDYLNVTGGDFSNAPSVGISSMRDEENKLGKHSVVLTGLNASTPYYFQVRSMDPNNNETIEKSGSDGYTFTTLSGPSISNISVTETTNTTATISWKTDIDSDSYVYYSSSPSLINPLSAGRTESTKNHIVSLENLTANLTYYFYVKSGAGENKNILNGEINYYNFITTSDSSAPILTFNQETDVIKTDNSIKISWQTNESSSSILEHGYGQTEQYSTVLHNDNYNTNHFYELTNLTKGTTYYIKIKNTDINNISSTPLTFIAATTDSTDYISPTISSISSSPIYDTSAIINWQTNEPTTTIIEYGKSYGSYTSSVSINSLNISHTKTLQELDIKTKYYYRITSKDGNNNSTTSSVYDFTTLDKLSPEDEIKIREDAARNAGIQNGQQNAGSVTTTIVIDKTDKIAPIISGLGIQNNGYGILTFSWKTNEQADSIIEYGKNESSYNLASVDLKMNIDHQIIINNLEQGTLYYYKITSTDSAGNRSISIIDSINTTGFKNNIDELLAENKNLLNSDVQAVNDNKFLDMLQKTVDFIKDAAKNVSMPILEASLIEQQKSLQELSTLTPIPKVIQTPNIQTWEDMAVISWETDKKTTSLVAYSENGVSLTDSKRAQTIGDPENLYLDHQVVLAGLKPETTYNYELRGKSALGIMADFPASKFSTKEKVAKVDNYNIDYVDEYSASFKWSTSIPTDTVVKLTPYRGNELSQGEEKIIKNSLVTSFHDITVEDLEPGIFYKIDLYGYDSSGRILSQSIETFSSTSKEIPLLVDQVKTDSALTVGEGMQVQAIISWNTTRPSTSKIYYRKKTNLNDDIWPNETNQDKNYTRKHLVVITDFDPGEVYQFQVESTDSNGAKIRSKTYTILTPRQKESVFQMILKNIEQTFGWVGTINK